jgi:hypothetical protein
MDPNCRTFFAREQSVENILVGFCRLEITSPKGEIIEWMSDNFQKSEIRDTLISYLSKKEIKVVDKFYHKDREFVIFYFQVYNRKSKFFYITHYLNERSENRSKRWCLFF